MIHLDQNLPSAKISKVLSRKYLHIQIFFRIADFVKVREKFEMQFSNLLTYDQIYYNKTVKTRALNLYKFKYNANNNYDINCIITHDLVLS